MATTEAGICNLALLRIGVRALVTSLQDDTEEAEACSIIYPQARDETLERFAWPFATRRALLAATTEVRSGYAHAYALPADCVAPRGFWEGRGLRPIQRTPYAIEANDGGTGRLLLTDVAPATLAYTSRTTDVTRFSALFTSAVAWRAAVELVLALAVDAAKGKMAADAYRAALQQAMAFEANTASPDAEPESEFVAARGGYNANPDWRWPWY